MTVCWLKGYYRSGNENYTQHDQKINNRRKKLKGKTIILNYKDTAQDKYD